MSKCKLCRKNEENITLLSADHKELGQIMVCQECWAKLYEKNIMICGRSSGGSSSCPTCK